MLISFALYGLSPCMGGIRPYVQYVQCQNPCWPSRSGGLSQRSGLSFLTLFTCKLPVLLEPLVSFPGWRVFMVSLLKGKRSTMSCPSLSLDLSLYHPLLESARYCSDVYASVKADRPLPELCGSILSAIRTTRGLRGGRARRGPDGCCAYSACPPSHSLGWLPRSFDIRRSFVG